MEVMNVCDAIDGCDPVADLPSIEIPRHAFEKDIRGVAQKYPCSRKLPSTNPDRDHGVDPGGGRKANRERSCDRLHQADHNGHDLQIKTKERCVGNTWGLT